MSDQSSRDRSELRFIEVSPDALSREALIGVVEEYITREGTEYGEREFSLAEKREQALRLLESGEVVIAFEPETGTTTLQQKERS